MRRLLAAATIGLIPLAASATDLPNTVLNVETSLAGAAGDDEGRGVAIDGVGDTLVAGYLAGAPDHGDDAVLAKFSVVDGSMLWSTTEDGGLIDGVSRVTSTDHFYGVTVTDTDEIVVTGSLSGTVADGWNSSFYVGKYDVTGSTLLWSNSYLDGGDSLVQAAHASAIDPGDGDVIAAGWAFRSQAIAGRWMLRGYASVLGLANAGPLGVDVGTKDFAPDRAWDIAIDADSNIVMVGGIGVDGATTSASNSDYDFHVRKYDSALGLLWDRTWSGLSGHDDVARGVAIDGDGNIIVAGYTNAGSDNDLRANFDWLVVKYDGVTGDLLWEVVWDAAADENEQAFAVDVDDAGDVLVGGYAGAGVDMVWRVAHLSGVDGAELAELTWGPEGQLLALDERDGQIALAGWVTNGADRDLYLRVLDADRDLDGVGDHADGCPDDDTKTEPLVCGCGKSEDDADADGYEDCIDGCPDLADKWEGPGVCGCDEPDLDGDDDGVEDCIDNCPTDPEKTELGICGCGIPDADSDGDGVMGCDDACSNTPAGTPVDDHGCPTGQVPGSEDTGDTDDVTAGGGSDKGCSSAPTGASGVLALLALALVRRRRS